MANKPSKKPGEGTKRRARDAAGAGTRKSRKAPTCPHCGKVYEGPAPPPGEILFCPACNAAIPVAPPGKARKKTTRKVGPAPAKGGTPPPQKKDAPTRTSKETTVLVCPTCKKQYTFDDFKAGDIRFCETCDASLVVKKKEGEVQKVLGNYEILEEVGRGGMAVVYKARQKGLDRMVALKVLLAGETASEAMVEDLHREAQSAAKLRHPNIVTVLDVGMFKNLHYIAMDLVEGKSLSDLVGKRRFMGRGGAVLMAKVARAIEHAHEEGVVHRDLKPSNILLGKKDEPQVMDFGLAKERMGKGVAGEGVAGTPEYMAPEQARGEEVDRRTDVFGMGAVLYALLAGRPPYRGESVQETLAASREGTVAPPREVNPSVPPDLEAICLKAMAREREDRYPSARALAEDLERYLKGQVATAYAASFPERVLRAVKRNPLLLFGSAGGLLLVMIVVAAVALGGGGSGDGSGGASSGAPEAPEEEEDADARARRDWEKEFGAKKQIALQQIEIIKGRVHTLLERASNQKAEDPDQALLTLDQAHTLLIELPDRVSQKLPGDFRDAVLEDGEVIAAGSARAETAAIAHERGSVLGSRAWASWEERLDLEAARMDYKQAFQFLPDDPALHFSRGMMFREAGLWAEAYRDMAKAVAMRPDFINHPDNLQYFLDAAARSGRGQAEEARIGDLPEEGPYRDYYRALFAMGKRDYEKAQNRLEVAKTKIDRKAPVFHSRCGIASARLLYEQGRLAETTEALDAILKGLRYFLSSRGEGGTKRETMLKRRELVDALVLRGLAYKERFHLASREEERVSFKNLALADLREALEIHPGDARARPVLDVLQGR